MGTNQESALTIAHGKALRDAIRETHKTGIGTQTTAETILSILESTEGESVLECLQRLEAKVDTTLNLLTILTRGERSSGAARG